MRFRVPIALFLLTMCTLACIDKSQAQAQQRAESGNRQPTAARAGSPPARDTQREQANDNVLFIVGDPLGQSGIAYASDIATVLNDGANLRLLPVIGSGSAQNVKDLLLLRGIDLALTDSATLNGLKRSKDAGPNLEKQIAYVFVLFPQELHLLARSEIKSVEDLRGKKVNFDVAGSAAALHAPDILRTLGIEVDAVHMSQSDAVEKMRSGELAATACLCAGPVSAFQSIKPGSGLKFLPVPSAKLLDSDFLPARLRTEDYPDLLAAGEQTETIATTVVLVTFNWPEGSTRYNRTAKLVEAFFSKYQQFLKPPRMPGWQSVNLSATLPGWQRFPATQVWLQRNSRAEAVSQNGESSEQTNQGSADRTRSPAQ